MSICLGRCSEPGGGAAAALPDVQHDGIRETQDAHQQLHSLPPWQHSLPAARHVSGGNAVTFFAVLSVF